MWGEMLQINTKDYLRHRFFFSSEFVIKTHQDKNFLCESLKLLNLVTSHILYAK